MNVFILADGLVVSVYAETRTFPADERFGLCAQLRRAAVSVAANIVEGCARRTTREYLHFVNIATGSCAETLYLLALSRRLGLLKEESHVQLQLEYTALIKGLKKLQSSLSEYP